MFDVILQNYVGQLHQMLSILPSKLKLDEEKSIYDSLAHQNGFGPAFLYNLGKLVKGTTKLKNSSSWSAVFFQEFLFVA
jgi:hypothetical protein